MVTPRYLLDSAARGVCPGREKLVWISFLRAGVEFLGLYSLMDESSCAKFSPTLLEPSELAAAAEHQSGFLSGETGGNRRQRVLCQGDSGRSFMKVRSSRGPRTVP